jgi:hypothetical protein
MSITKNEIAENGTAENGTAENGTAENGTAENGTAENGTAENGTAENGTEENETVENEITDMKNIKDFQEFIRILDATLYKVDSVGMLNGQNTLFTISNFINYPGMKEKVGQKFYDFVTDTIKNTQTITDNLSESNANVNVREFVKKILMYPATSYEPMMDVTIPDDTLQSLKKQLGVIRFRIIMYSGKVYAMRIENMYENMYDHLSNDYRKIIMSVIGDTIKEHCRIVESNDVKLILNPEPQHITLINSNIVQDCGEDQVCDFIEDFRNDNKSFFTVEFGKVKTTVSNDWSLFSRCYVMEITSDYLNKFIREFNDKFNDKLKKPIKVCLHTTFAIVPRSLNLF